MNLNTFRLLIIMPLLILACSSPSGQPAFNDGIITSLDLIITIIERQDREIMELRNDVDSLKTIIHTQHRKRFSIQLIDGYHIKTKFN